MNVVKFFEKIIELRSIPLSRTCNLEMQSTRIKYYIDRGYSESEGKALLKIRQDNISVKSLMKSRNITKKQAILDLKKITNQATTTLNNRQDIDEINFAKGKSVRIEWYFDKINPTTNELYTIDEAKATLSKRQSIGFTLLWQRVRDGESDYVPNTTIQYYLNKGFTPDESKQLLSDRQTTFSKDLCIKNHGVVKGMVVWETRQIKWRNTLDLKSDEEKADILRRQCPSNQWYSKASIKFFDKLLEELKLDNTSNIFYKDNERFVHNRTTNKIYFYDFCLYDIMFIIEYNGSHVHPNIKVLEHTNTLDTWKHVYNKKTAVECHLHDDAKNNLAIENGYTVFTVWDTDDEDTIIKQLTTLIKEKYEQL